MNVALVLALQLHKEDTYAKMEPSDAEMFRRMWWLVFTGDRSGALSEGQVTLLPPEDLISTNEPPASCVCLPLV